MGKLSGKVALVRRTARLGNRGLFNVRIGITPRTVTV
jgi:hypothetical protein